MNSYYRVTWLLFTMALATARMTAKADILISKYNLSDTVVGNAQFFDFEIQEGYSKAELTITGPATGRNWRVAVGIACASNPLVVTTFTYISKGKYLIEGLAPGQWKAEIYGYTTYSSVNFVIEGTKTVSDVTEVPDLPGIMDANDWPIAASLLRHWLSLDQNSVNLDDTTTVKMDWELQFGSPSRIYRSIYARKIYKNTAALKVMRQELGSLAPGHHIIHSNFDYTYGRYLGILLTGVNDFDSAIHGFNFEVDVVVDYLPPNARRACYARILAVGVYLKDDYNFPGSQYLGDWNKNTNYVGFASKVGILLGTPFHDGDFRNYAARTGKGRDFVVFSDTKWTTLEKPVLFYVKTNPRQ